jgi:uncharacterized damage-inducible protein DinB
VPVTENRGWLELAQVQRLVAFHHWAAALLFGEVATLSTQELDAPWGGSFGSGRALLRHVVGAERLWCDRFAGVTAARVPDFPATHSGADFRSEWERVSDELQRFAKQLTQGSLDRDLTYVNIRGETKTYRYDDLFFHIVNHGTYHRGQIAQLLRDRGRAAPSTDFLLYIEAERKR